MIHLIGADLRTSTDMIAKIAIHLPVGASMGRILAASPDAVMSDTGVWGICDLYAWRMVQLSDGSWERTRYYAGAEVLRTILRDREPAT